MRTLLHLLFTAFSLTIVAQKSETVYKTSRESLQNNLHGKYTGSI
jgi:hypothetical protein